MGLKFWERKPLEKPFPEKLARRVSKLSTADLLLWAEQSLSETNRNFSLLQSSGNDQYISDLLMGAEALNALISEYKRRLMV